jgi:hypothetical protein
MVQGDCFKGQDKDQQGNPRRDQAGNLKTVWFVGLAIAKGPEWDQLWTAIYQKAAVDFPNGEYQQPDFSWKVVDGDDPKFAGRDGFPGHWILRCQSGFAPKVYDNSTPPNQIVDPNAVKRGYYLQIGITVEGNKQFGAGQRSGIYCNCNMIQLAGYGPEIQGGRDPSEVFAQRGALPPGASATPLAPAPIVQGQIPPAQAPQPVAQAPGYAAPPVMAGPPVGAPAAVQAPGVVVPLPPGYAPQGAPAAPPVMPVAPPMPGAPPVAAAAPVVAPAAPGVAVPGAIAPAPTFVQPGAPVPINPATGLPYA